MGYAIGILAAFVLILAIRAFLFRPYPQAEVPACTLAVDKERAVANLAKMVQCRTVSSKEEGRVEEGEFEKFRQLLPENYPLVHSHCEFWRVGPNGLLYRWPGKRGEKPTVFMAHYDVVPAAAQDWQHPPFAGVIDQDCLWGRGTLDTKGTLCAILEGAELLIGQGFVPENDIYLSFGGDEEVDGTGAAGIVEFLRERGVKPHLVLDEGGAIVEKDIPGVPGKYALVGTGEKGKLHLRLSVQSRGGHASSPPPRSPVGVLARAVVRVEKKPFAFRLAKPVAQMFDVLGRHAGFALKLLYANLDLFAPLLGLAGRMLGGEVNALVRTTVAFTKMQASEAVNVFPPAASVEADVRLMEGSTKESVLAGLKKRIDNKEVKIEALGVIPVAPFSEMGGEAWQRLEEAIRAVWPGIPVSPYLMVAASDSRQYTAICENVFRFAGMELSAAERRMIHGTDERIPLAKIETAVKFFACLMQKS